MGLGSLGAAILSVKILVDAGDAAKGMGDAATGVQKFQSKISGLVGPAALVGGAVLGMGKSALSAASDAEQAMGGVDTVFGKSADKVKAWGDQAAKSSGLSATEYATAAAKIGSQLKTAGVPMDQIADKTAKIIQQGADLSATYGGTAADAVDALSSAMRGEADPAERLGLGLSQAAVQAEMAAEGTDKLTGSAATAAKAQATMNLITKQGASSWGQFSAQSNTAAEAQQIAGASMKNMAATLGGVLLPVATAAGQAMAVLADWIQKNSTVVLILVGVIATLAGGILAAAAAMKVYQGMQTAIAVATKVWAGVQWLLNAALNANPVGLVVIAVVALVAAIVLLWTKSEAFRNFFIGVWHAIQAAAAAAWAFIVNAGKVAVAALLAAWRAIQQAAAAAWAFIVGAAKAALSGIVAAWRAMQAAAAAVWAAVTGAVRAALSAVTGAVRAAGSAIATAWRAVGTAAAAVWSAIRAAVGAAAAWIVGRVQAAIGPISNVWQAILAAARTVWDGIKAIVKTVVDYVIAIWQTVTGAVQAVWSKIEQIVTGAIAPIKSAIQAVADLWNSTVGAISNGIEKVGGWLGGLVGKAKSIGSSIAGALPGGKSAPAGAALGYPVTAGGADSPGLSARALSPTSTSSSAGGGHTFIIQGAVDPDGTARQIKGILAGRDRRTSGVRIGGLATA